MIGMNDFRAEPEALRQQEFAALERVLRSGWYVLGQELKTFETSWAQRCGVGFTVGVGNGMDAIEIGLRAIGIGSGDEVITTPMTAFATVLAVIRAGATPVLADIDPETALLDPLSVERCLSSRTKAVLLVHLYGQMREMTGWMALCAGRGIHLLEDCAQAHLASVSGKVAGSFGTWGAYSFYPTKNLGAIGDGGALVTHVAAIAQQAQILRNYGQTERYHHPELGLNSRLDELQAALLSVRLTWLEEFTARRQQIAQAYYAGIKNPHILLLAQPAAAENHVYHLFVIRCQQRQRLSAYLTEKGIANLSHYPIPIHRQPPCQNVRCDPNGLVQAEVHAAQCLSIPCHPQMSDRDVAYVIEVMNEYK
ncbi:DegT/DnrJ/EryC1/StrS family aminotransferase [Kovacikia minuta CCNUW1]|uniref:DegT/DnrJ/EryC1/StrS family aminotransferase n=1 Tax=Kovacikia minuta TaxID=2931930 RepID=UPI001CCD495F|nr:DegT/DnrJ/EryC1/StrS family aminotransferase [Kovacikia minuta]UBF24684.1 DegT/DnrJ/EryC1/StrS family aminotransferase [Kovacikia minuta CCNUW1]